VLRGLFVAGTDTGVGKTAVAAAILLRFRQRFPIRYWKPIQTGAALDDDTAAVTSLAACREDEVLAAGARFAPPLSPHLAATMAGRAVTVASLLEPIRSQGDGTCWVVEGAGGVLVPLNRSEYVVDLIAGLGLPAVIAARAGLGTINHTLLTIEALRHRSIAIAGVVLVGATYGDNRASIEQHGQVAILGEMPYFEPLSPDRLAAWAASSLDPANRLPELLR
jgi:dethiobiotin synthase